MKIQDLSMQYGSKPLFENVDLDLQKGHRYGIVGANGTGKSTFLKIIAGEVDPNSGQIQVSKDTTMGWMKQDQFKHENDRVIDVVIQGRPQLWSALVDKDKLLEECENWDDEAGFKLAEYEEIIAHYNGYVAEEDAKIILTGLGIPVEKQEGSLSQLSGGFKLRVLLAQALFSDPNVLLLDEPTNHLDIVSIAWMEDFLASSFKGILIFVSHDIDFVNRVSSDILDFDYGLVRHYPGNYVQFLAAKKLAAEQIEHAIKHAKEKMADTQMFVDRFRATASKAKQVHSRVKMLEKMKKDMPKIEQSTRVYPRLLFKQKRPSGKVALKIDGLSKQFEDKVVLKDVGVEIHRGEKIAIIGKNGLGKSTLLKILMQQIKPDAGEFTWGHETSISYFAQDHHEQIHGKESIYQWLHDEMSNVPETEIRQALGRMLFSGDDTKKRIDHLSGGEAARVCFAKAMLEMSNVLALDEPTNHLDIESIEALAKSLNDYPGTLLLVSHDQFLVKEVATRIIMLTEDGIYDYHGNYDEFLAYYEEQNLMGTQS